MGDETKRSGSQRAEATGKLEPWEAVELQRLTADIAARLRKACGHLPDDEFAALVLDIAQRRMRFDGLDPVTGRQRK